MWFDENFKLIHGQPQGPGVFYFGVGGEPKAALKPGSIPITVEPVKIPTPVKMPEPTKEPVKV